MALVGTPANFLEICAGAPPAYRKNSLFAFLIFQKRHFGKLSDP